LSILIIALVSAGLGAAAAFAVLRRPRSAARRETSAAARKTLHWRGGSPIDAAAPPTRTSRLTPAKSTALGREAQERFESREAARDFEILNRLLRDIRDLTAAEEAICWRWVESRQTLVPGSWSTEGTAKPTSFDMRAWGPLVRSSAEYRELQLVAGQDGAPEFAAAPILGGPGGPGVVGVLTLTSRSGLRLDGDGAREWLPRFAAQVGALIQLFELRRDYGRHMRQSQALLDAVKRMHGHRNAEKFGEALCETARDVTSAPVAAIVRWNDADKHGVVQATSAGLDIDPGFHVTADSLVGQACLAGLPLLLEDAAAATSESDPFGGIQRNVGSVAIVPVKSEDQVIGALVVEGKHAGDVSQLELRNLGLLAAVARGPLEIIWEIEEVSLRARTDPLTGLSNRRHFDEELRRVVAQTDRFGGTCSLILVDLDHFKQVNDQFGHEAGDSVLRHVAQVLRDAVREVDTCARYGGEEVAVLSPQTSPEGVFELAERLRSTLESRPSSHAGQLIPLTASFGVATYPAPVPYGDWLVLAADKALYEAKASGRNCVRMIQPNQVTPALYKSR
jgi:diguanylate cyclase (GGDEF)-like protein